MALKTFLSVIVFPVSAAVAAGDCGAVAVSNPERGFRHQIHVGLESDEKPPSNIVDNWPFAAYAADGAVVAQAYCYLTRYCDSPIPQTKLEALQVSFDRARKDGVKFLLRFAYERDMSRTKGPALQRILSHVIELGGIVRRNADVVYALQLGWVGAWGEFHSSASGVEFDKDATAKIVQYTMKYMLPPNRCAQVRTMQILEDVSVRLPEDVSRIGLFNDATLANFFDSGTFMPDRGEMMKMAWDEILGTTFAMPGGKHFDRLCEVAKGNVPVDGELYWKNCTDWAQQNGLEALVRFRRHRYSTFGLVHGNSEFDTRPGIGPVDTWKKTPVTSDLLAAFGIPHDPEYFSGVPFRTAFDYIRDHLGYRLVVKRCGYSEGRIALTLHNYGFAAPVNPRKAYFVVLSEGGSVTEISTGTDCRNFAAEEDAVISASIAPLKPGERLALWMPDEAESLRFRPEYAIGIARGTTEKIVGGRRLNLLENVR